MDLINIAGAALIALGILWIIVAAAGTAISRWLAARSGRALEREVAGATMWDVLLAIVNLIKDKVPAAYVGGFLLIGGGIALILGHEYLSTRQGLGEVVGFCV